MKSKEAKISKSQYRHLDFLNNFYGMAGTVIPVIAPTSHYFPV